MSGSRLARRAPMAGRKMKPRYEHGINRVICRMNRVADGMNPVIYGMDGENDGIGGFGEND